MDASRQVFQAFEVLDIFSLCCHNSIQLFACQRGSASVPPLSSAKNSSLIAPPPIRLNYRGSAVLVGVQGERDVWRTSILTNYVIKALGKPCFILKLIRFGDGACYCGAVQRMKHNAGQISDRRSSLDFGSLQIGPQ